MTCPCALSSLDRDRCFDGCQGRIEIEGQINAGQIVGVALIVFSVGGHSGAHKVDGIWTLYDCRQWLVAQPKREQTLDMLLRQSGGTPF